MAPTTKREMNWGCFLICWAVSLGQIAFGYPGTFLYCRNEGYADGY
jgi:hypothetical protein